MNMSLVTLVVEPEGRRVKARTGSSLLETVLESGVGMRTDCGGKGKCGKCRVIIKDQSKATPLTKIEKNQLTELEIKAGYRLACQLQIIGNSSIFIPSESRIHNRRFLVEGLERPVGLDPTIKKIHIHLPEPMLSHPEADAERLTAFLEKAHGLKHLEVDYGVLRNLPKVLRNAKWDITVVLWKDHKVLSIESGDTSDSAYGVAVDIGTSKIVASLVSLLNGETLAISSIENPQIIHGEDVLSRISYATMDEKGLEDLTSLALKGVNSVILEACERANVDINNVYEGVIVGNTVMHHIFLGIQPKFLALAPYTPAVKHSMNLKAEKIGVKINPTGNIYIPPIIAGFVGSDNVCDIVSTSIHEKDEESLLLDIGTNTEVNVGNKDILLSCSCASGPAFEGAHITHGMKAVEGAIEKVKINPKTFKVEYETIGNSKPVGICGSAMIDILAEMLKNHLLDKTGRFQEKRFPERFKKRDGIAAFTIVSGDDTETGEDIVITQGDVRELQLAKAAIYTGCWILMEKREVEPRDLESVYIAGAFGNYIEPTNAKVIGLIPDVPVDRIRLVGNTALAGAKMALKSREVREKAEEVSKMVRYLELGADPSFNKEFSAATFFPHMDSNRFPSVKKMFEDK